MGERYGRLREARHRRERARMEDRELYPVQPVRLCLPARRDPSVPRNGDRSSRFGRRVEAGAGRDEGLQVPHPDFAARLYGLQQLRGRLPRQGEGAGDETARIAAAPAEELGLYRKEYRLQAGRGQDQERQEPAVRTTALRVLRRLRRLRRDSLYQGYFAAVRREDDGGQRHGLYLDLFGFGSFDAVLHQRQGAGPRMGQFALRGQRRVRSGYARGRRETPRPYSGVDGAGDRRLYEVLGRAEGRHAGVDRRARFVGQVGRGFGPPDPDDGGLRLRLLQGHSRNEGLAGEEVAVDHRRRRLGLRHRLRRRGPRAGFGAGCEYSGRGYRGLLEYRRSVVEIDARGRRRQVRVGR